MILKVAIADTNVDYVGRIADVLGGYPDVKISMYTDKSKLELAVTSKNIDVLLFDPSIYTGEVGLKSDTLAIMLVDDEVPIPETCKSFKKVKKYQRISRVYNKILEYYSEFCPSRGIDSEGKTNIYAFYSPVGGVGKTTIALATAARLASMGKKVLYVNLEDIPSDGFYLPQDGEHGLSLLATQLGENVNFGMKVQSLLQNKSENFFYVNHFDSPNDSYDLTEDEAKMLLEQLATTSLFNCIVVDLGIGLDKKILSVFDIVDKVVIVEKHDNVSIQKLKTFYDQAHIVNAFAEKMIRVQNLSYGARADITDKAPLVGSINAVMNPDAAQPVNMMASDASLSFVAQL